jgi:hypothetical protein
VMGTFGTAPFKNSGGSVQAQSGTSRTSTSTFLSMAHLQLIDRLALQAGGACPRSSLVADASDAPGSELPLMREDRDRSPGTVSIDH